MSMVNLQLAQHQYISDWHFSFVNHIRWLLAIIEVMENHPSATDEDKRGFDQIKKLLNGREALEIERSLAEADIKQDVLDKIEKLYKDMVDMAIEHLSTEALLKEFLKKLSYYQIEQNKRLAKIRLMDLLLLK
jgi:stalled ribosome rescue protein Dom34